MKVKVDSSICVGCGFCQSMCSDIFKVEDQVSLITENVPEDKEEDVKDAAEGCPVGAITVVEDNKEEK